MKTNNPFKVPDNYFQDFKLEIMDVLPEKKNVNKVFLLKTSLIKWSAVAAVILIFILVGVNYMDSYQKGPINYQNSTQITSDQTSSSEQQYAALQDDYLLFVEDQATLSVYKDVLGLDDF